MPDEEQDWHSWRRLKTGKASAAAGPSFVRATKLTRRWGEVRPELEEEEGSGEEGEEEDDDIFSRPMMEAKETQSASRRETDSVSTMSLDNVHTAKEQSMSSFYAELAKNMPAQSPTLPLGRAITPRPEPQRPKKSGYNRHEEMLSKRKEDWFIEKARMKLLGQAMRENSGEKDLSRTSQTIAQRLTTEPPLPQPMKPKLAHSSSVAAVAPKGPNEEPTMALRPGNLGYAALERMGWRVGMGLGRDEYEWAASSGLLRPGEIAQGKNRHREEVDLCSESDVGEDSTRKNGAKERQRDPVTISDDSDDSDEGEDGAGWLEKIIAQGDDDGFRFGETEETAQEFLSDTIDAAQPHSEPGSASPPARSDDHRDQLSRTRPRLTPLSLHVRPDRRGVGVSLPSSSRVRDLPHEITQFRRNHSTLRHRELEAQGRRTRKTKKQRREDLEREKEEWKSLRNSLR
ncbi:hypothetical protein FA10DRAFT_264153 [Acaromyces ingoldii]|uniref:G-patch domain-containing protein n=1 Tax=Acaromyces ingoldii TaxID=215250 RepID=A0A316Z094_9BASI|nr:hypothetical protein FA10DRAFT_264153 [Acaromyces ingoldii]PWN93515.1 hypothetical protein FA10DRAFT_264153 [Acaromyces ingoldii]